MTCSVQNTAKSHIISLWSMYILYLLLLSPYSLCIICMNLCCLLTCVLAWLCSLSILYSLLIFISAWYFHFHTSLVFIILLLRISHIPLFLISVVFLFLSLAHYLYVYTLYGYITHSTSYYLLLSTCDLLSLSVLPLLLVVLLSSAHISHHLSII